MNRLLSASMLLFCIAGLCAAGCSSTKSPTASTTGGSDSGTQADSGPEDTAIRTVTPDDTHLLYSGRIDFTDPTQPVYSAPGVTVTAAFTGVSISVMFQDSFTGSNYYNVIVDGTQTFLIQPKSQTTKYDVVPNAAQNIPPLAYGQHTVVFVKRTEASQGPVTFLGFEFGGAPAPAPAGPTRRIEIIGDSISTGSGDEPGVNQVSCNTDGGNPAQNAYLSYGAVLARNLNAEYHISSAAGRGAMRNYECGSLDTLPAVYDHINLHDMTSPIWDHKKYVPDAIILALGTNDFSPDDCNEPPLSPECDPSDYQLYITDMEQFIAKLRGYFPDAQVILTSSPMLVNGWPTPVQMGDAGQTCDYTSRTSHIAAMTTVVEYFNAAGDAKVHLVDTVPKGRGLGCGTHPNVTEQMEIGGTPDSYNPNAADILLNPVKAIMGW